VILQPQLIFSYAQVQARTRQAFALNPGGDMSDIMDTTLIITRIPQTDLLPATGGFYWKIS